MKLISSSARLICLLSHGTAGWVREFCAYARLAFARPTETRFFLASDAPTHERLCQFVLQTAMGSPQVAVGSSVGGESWPLVALGVLSGTSAAGLENSVQARFITRRQLVRTTWMRHDNVERGGRTRRSVVARFVLRCGGLEASHPVRSEPDVLCSPIPAQESRLRGPILALHFWLGYALEAYPAARFICKSDDDVYLHVPDIEAHLRSIPLSRAPHAYYGDFNFYHVLERPATATTGSRFAFHGFGPTFGWAKHVAAKHGYEKLCPTSNAADADGTPPAPGANATSCAGPFPYVNGPFLALGRQVVARLVWSPGVLAELERLRRLPQKHRMVVEDVWLGSALWRHVGGQLPLQLYALNSMRDSVYMDTDGFRVGQSLVVFHNRRKYINRLVVLHEYAQVEHCSLPPRWKTKLTDCCGTTEEVWRRSGRFEGGSAWPYHLLEVANQSVCAGDHEGGRTRRMLTDLRNVTTLRRLGVLRRLPAEAQGNVMSWLRRKG